MVLYFSEVIQIASLIWGKNQDKTQVEFMILLYW